MDRTLGTALLVVGIILVVWGITSAESLSSDVSNFFTGSPTEKSIWLLVAGVVLTCVGGSSFLRRT